jgi:hypothetical protein
MSRERDPPRTLARWGQCKACWIKISVLFLPTTNSGIYMGGSLHELARAATTTAITEHVDEIRHNSWSKNALVNVR